MVHSFDILASYLKHLSPLQSYFSCISRRAVRDQRKAPHRTEESRQVVLPDKQKKQVQPVKSSPEIQEIEVDVDSESIITVSSKISHSTKIGTKILPR